MVQRFIVIERSPLLSVSYIPNPKIKLSDNWTTLWKGYQLINLLVNLEINTSISTEEKFVKVPYLQVANFSDKISNTETRITGEIVEVIPFNKFFTKSNVVTQTFIKAYVVYKFCNILNGDFFRSQADNLTKFSQIMLEDKIINPSQKFKIDEETKENGNTDWIEYIYFSLYFQKNPNKKVYNIDYSFDSPITIGGNYYNKKRTYTLKRRKNKKYTKRNLKKNKKTLNKNKNNKKHRKTYKQRGGNLDKLNNFINYYDFKSPKLSLNQTYNELFKQNNNNKPYIESLSVEEMLSAIASIESRLESFSHGYTGQNEQTDLNTNSRTKTDYKKKLNFIKEKLNDVINESADSKGNNYRNEEMFSDDSKDVPSSNTRDEDMSNSEPSDDKGKSRPNTREDISTAESKDKTRPKLLPYESPKIIQEKISQLSQEASEKENMGAEDEISRLEMQKQQNANMNQVSTRNVNEPKDLVFSIKTDFDNFRDVKSLIQEIKHITKKDDSTIFDQFLNDYDTFLSNYATGNDFADDKKFINFVYVYILLQCYSTAYYQLNKKEGPFDINDWWFFDKTQFNDIVNDLDIDKIMSEYNKIEEPPNNVEPVSNAEPANNVAPVSNAEEPANNVAPVSNAEPPNNVEPVSNSEPANNVEPV